MGKASNHITFSLAQSGHQGLQYRLPKISKLQRGSRWDLLSTLNARDNVYVSFQSVLRQLTASSGTAHTTFISPPVCACVSATCARRGPLVKHHDEVKATIYTLSGPIPATKISLRCKWCNTIYNYSQYGRKQSDGEKYYRHQPRPLVEVSVYCECQLYELFCCLR